MVVGRKVVPQSVKHPTRVFQPLQRVCGIVEVPKVNVSEVEQDAALCLSILTLADDGKRAHVVMDSFLMLPKLADGGAQVAQLNSFTLSVSELAAEFQRLLDEINGLLVPSKVFVNETKATEAAGLALFVTELAANGQ